MGETGMRLEKPTLDKDLDKVSLAEEMTLQTMRPVAGLGAGLVFLVLSVAFAASAFTGTSGLAVILAGAALAAYMAMNIGANDVTNNVGAAVGAKAMTLGTALAIAAVCEIAGALIAGGAVVERVGFEIVDAAAMPDGDAMVRVMLAALLSSAVWINIATYANAPVSTTHSIVGGILGAGLLAGGPQAVNWLTLSGITLSWMVSPLLGGGIAALILFFVKETIIYRDDKIAAARRWMPVLIAAMAGCFAAFLAAAGIPGLFDLSLTAGLFVGAATALVFYLGSRDHIRRQSEGFTNRNQDLRKLFRLPLIGAAGLLSFAHGANDVSNAIGPLSAIVVTVGGNGGAGAIPAWVMLIGAFGISVGLLLFGPRLIRIVGQEITRLNPMRAFCVALSTAATVIVASMLGIPISSTHTAVGAVFGVGLFREWYTRNSRRRRDYIRRRTGHVHFMEADETNTEEAQRRRLVRRSHLLTIGAAWVVTLPVAALLSALIFLALGLVLP
ncbi:inorganic phosphate transporter [Ensifer soli]|uniref:inorganic phosphate transporter n=1 Tax=Ciceribacter sp. sgz301302 TaxID=3342379 RepID=UPI0035B76DAC